MLLEKVQLNAERLTNFEQPKASPRLLNLLLFVVVLSATLVWNLAIERPKVTLIYDAAAYLETCRYVTSFLLAAVHGHWNMQLLLDPVAVGRLMIDGPVLPSLFAVIFTALGRLPEHTDWRILVIGQSVLHGTAALLVSSLSFRVSRRKSLSFWCGMAWGLYPAAVIATGQFLTEPLAVLLLLSFVWFLTTTKQNSSAQIATGLVAGLIILLKPALIPAILLAVAWNCGLKKIRAALIILAAAALVVAPWAVYTKTATGKMCITTQRCPAANLAVGCDTETGGWALLPLSPLSMLLEDAESPIAPVLGQWTNHPTECLSLTVSKVTSLLGRPFNDFRQNCWGLDAQQQGYWHSLLLLLGLFAMAAMMVGCQPALDEKAKRLLQTCVILAVVQLFSYLAFDPLTRYGFTIVPLLTVLAGWGYYVLFQAMAATTVSRIRAGLAIILAVGVTSGILAADGLCNLSNNQEIAHIVLPECKIEKYIDLSAATLPGQFDSALLLVDADKELEKAEIVVNGTRLSDAARLIYCFDPAETAVLPIVRQQAVAMGLTVNDLRQWRAVVLPAALVKPGLNHITIVPKLSALTIFADTDTSKRHFPSLGYMSLHKMFASTTSIDARLESPVSTAKVKQASWISNSYSGSRTEALNSALRIKILLLPGAGAKIAAGKIAGLENFKQDLLPKNFDPLLSQAAGNPNSVRINKQVLKYARSTEYRIDVPQLIPSNYLHIKIQGHLRRLQGPGKIGIAVALVGKHDDYHVLDLLPTYVSADDDWHTFELHDLISQKILARGIKSIRLNLYPCPWTEAHYGSDSSYSDALLRNMSVQITPVNQPDISSRQPVIY